MLNMAGPARVQQLIHQARTTFSKPKGEPSFLEEFERLKSVVSDFIRWQLSYWTGEDQ